jgi:hypothetical protein
LEEKQKKMQQLLVLIIMLVRSKIREKLEI